MRRLLWTLVALVAMAGGQACAEERITSFASSVTVNADASIEVRETIAIVAEGAAIRRGILRDFPTTYTDRLGRRVVVGFEVIEVRRDGRPEPWSLESLSNGRRIRIGSADVFLARGLHSYDITYRSTRQIGFFADHDELYWNVTGNDWQFPIEHASVAVRLPPGARLLEPSAYTGPMGAAGRDFRFLTASQNEFRAETTRRLAPQEGFTVAVPFAKGLLQEPGPGERWSWWLGDNAGFAALAAGLLAALGYYVFAWFQVGRDPPAGTIIPLFRPPEGLGPAGARFVIRHGLDDRGLAAALVSLAVKGRLTISDGTDGGFAVTRLTAPAAASALTQGEQALLTALPHGTTELTSANHDTIGKARKSLARVLANDYEGTVFIRNLPWFWGGALISLAGLGAAALLMPGADSEAALFAFGFSGIWWAVVLSVAWATIRNIMSAGSLMGMLGRLAMLLFLIPFVIGGFGGAAAVFFGGTSPGHYLIVGGAVALGLVNLVFFYLLRAPTLAGRRLLDQVEGFRMYLETAEEERLKILHPPEKTPELFERYLPYAMALDCENAWNAKFATVLAAAAAAGAAAPSWYSGSRWDAGSGGGFTEGLGRSLSESVAAAASAPGSSSGSFGGGSSGGGGGGGGGSGW